MLSFPAITNFVQHHQLAGYLIVFLGVVIEGEFTLIVTGVLAHIGAFAFGDAFLIAIAGGMTKTFFGYRLGRLLRDKYAKSRFFRFVVRKVNGLLPKFREKPFWSVFVSKFIFGLNNLVLIYSGFMHVRRTTYFKAEIVSTFVWAFIAMGLGYVFSIAAFNISHDIRKFMLLFLLFLVGFVILQRIMHFLIELAETKKDILERDHLEE
jgi:membrane protein DedA with SNARE-associated domain